MDNQLPIIRKTNIAAEDKERIMKRGGRRRIHVVKMRGRRVKLLWADSGNRNGSVSKLYVDACFLFAALCRVIGTMYALPKLTASTIFMLHAPVRNTKLRRNLSHRKNCVH